MLSKAQVDKVGARLKDGDVDESVITALELYRAEFGDSYKLVEMLLRDRLGHEVTGRPAKSTVAIMEKLRRQSTRLSQMQDIAGCRIIVPTVLMQDSLGNALKIMYDDVVVDDKRKEPTNNYRALHVIPKVNGKHVEIQVRTELQHVWADASERLADVHGQEVKYGMGKVEVVDFLSRFSLDIAKFEQVGRKYLEFQRSGVSLTEQHRRSRKKIAKGFSQELRLASYQIKLMVNQLPGFGVK